MESHLYFTQNLIHWYRHHYRDLPWRQNTNPYSVWISEIILQQTQVQQGIPYFKKFMNHFPIVEDLASASQQKVLGIWQGLGYYRRAINLHKTAQIITKKYRGTFPATYDQLVELPGIGDYTASAILSICFRKPHGVVDANVYRFFARYFGIEIPLGSSLAFKTFKTLSNKYLDKDCPDVYNQAIMEFGALVCTYQNPQCTACIFQSNCYAFKHHKIHMLPLKRLKKMVKSRFFNYLIIKTPNQHVLLEKRKTNDIWPGLYQFPLIESSKEVQTVGQLISEMGTTVSLINQDTVIEKWNENSIIHRLSHQKLSLRFWIITPMNTRFKNSYPIDQLSALPLPIVLSTFVKKFFQIH